MWDSRRENIGAVPFIKIDSGGGEKNFSYSGMMFLYDFPKMHQEFIDNGEDFVVLEEVYNEVFNFISHSSRVFVESTLKNNILIKKFVRC